MVWKEYWAATAGTFKRLGYPNIDDVSAEAARRDALGAYGTYAPTAADTGAITSEAILANGSNDYNSDVDAVNIPDGAVIMHKRIFGDITFLGTALLWDCLCVGGNNLITTGNKAVVFCNNDRTGVAVIRDCTIRARKESDGRDGFLGKQYTAERCNVSNVVDGFGIYNFTGGYNSASNVNVKGNYIHDHAYTYPDRDHSDGDHTDGVQCQGGTNVNIIGNTLIGTGHYMAGSGTYYDTHASTDAGDWPLLMPTPRTPGSGILVNGNQNAVDSTVVVDGNYIHYYKIPMNVGTQANGFVCTNNRFSVIDTPAKNVNGTVRNGVTLAFTANEYWVRLANQTTYNPNIIGLTTSGVVTNTTNKWMDGANVGVALSAGRVQGINDNQQA